MIKVNKNYSYKTCTVEKTVTLHRNNGEEIGEFKYKSHKYLDGTIKLVESVANEAYKVFVSNQLKNS